MHTLSIFVSIVIDILTISALLYVFLKLKYSKKKQKSKLSAGFERFRREKILRSSLFILAFAFLFDAVAVYGDLFHLCSSDIVEISQVISHALLFIFVLYIIQATGEASKN
jgi:hypothetical protein